MFLKATLSPLGPSGKDMDREKIESRLREDTIKKLTELLKGEFSEEKRSDSIYPRSKVAAAQTETSSFKRDHQSLHKTKGYRNETDWISTNQ